MERRVLVQGTMSPRLIIVGGICAQNPAQVHFTEYDHVVSRRIEPMSLSTYAFCQGERNAIGRSRIPMARRRCTKTVPYEMSRSRMRYRGAWSHGKASVIWREIHSAVGFPVTPNDSQIRCPCRMMTRQ